MVKFKPEISWLEDPNIFKVNRIPAHSDHFFYENEEDAQRGEMRLKQTLNGTWKFSYAPNPAERICDFYEENVSCDGFESIQVPGHIQLQGYDNCQYINTMYPWDGKEELRPPKISQEDNPVGSYVKHFEVAPELLHKRTFLSFQGVETAFYVWLNGKFVGYGEDSFTPSEYEVTEYLKEGQNKLAVEVYKRSSASWLEDQDFWRFSGIFREVYLYAVPDIHIRDIFVKAGLDETYQDGRLQIGLFLEGNADCQVEAELRDTCGTLVWKDESASGITAYESKSISGTRRNICGEIPGVHPWSAEEPYLYELVCKAYDGERLVEVTSQKIGFRNFEMIDKVMCLNGKRIVFKGVNRHEFHHKKGRAITEEEMLWDIRFLKQNNINAVRTSHYPNQSLWYRLCDEYGIYLIDETNLETHGSWQKLGVCEPSWNVPGDKDEWRACVVDRARNMFERDKNHPSVLIWSCGNESYAGTCIAAISDFFHENDDSRLVHYEGVFWNRKYDAISDMESRMYAKPNEIIAYLEAEPEKPYISCEYMHAMGNSCGGLKLYTDLEDAYTMYQGGFIWDYIDQSILHTNEHGEEVFTYGGDFDDRATDYEFCGNGIVFADRIPTPKVQEVKALYADVRIRPDRKGVQIENRNLFVSTEKYVFICRMRKDGVAIWEQEAAFVVEPGRTEYFEIDYPTEEGAGEYICEISMCLREDEAWAESGHELAFGQYIYEVKGQKPSCETKIQIVHGDVNVGVKGEDFLVMFSRSEGGIASLVYDGREYITRAPKQCFWRACTDNDRGAGQLYDRGIWLAAGLGQKLEDVSIVEKENEIILCFCYRLLVHPEARSEITYCVNGDGKIHVKAEYHGIEGLPQLPAYGMEMHIKERYRNFRYYGYGPEENYIDRMEGARLGIFFGDAEGNLTPYLVPQECGNRVGTRWLEVTDDEGCGLRFAADGENFESSVLPYSVYEIENAMHREELPQVHDTCIRLLAAQMGVGGDDSWGAPVHDEYLISSAEAHEVSFTISKV